MLKIVLDTNVLASGAVANQGTMKRLMDAWQAEVFQLYISRPILQELQRTLQKPYFAQRIPSSLVVRYLTVLVETSTLVSVASPVPRVATHPEDDFILATAAACEADYLVTGDEQLLKLRSYRGVTIISPYGFCSVLEG